MVVVVAKCIANQLFGSKGTVVSMVTFNRALLGTG